MARVTVEDCITKIPNRYELVAVAARRAKDIAAGAPITLPRDNDKDAVVSLREIAQGTVDLDQLREAVVQSFQHKQSMERFVSDRRDSKSSEIDETFADQSAAAGLLEDQQKAMEKAGMSFGEENIEVED